MTQTRLDADILADGAAHPKDRGGGQIRGDFFPVGQMAGATFPPLHTPGAWTILRDRWERLGTTVHVAAPPEAVWRALTDPEALRLWLAVCHGSLVDTERDTMLDFEDGEFFLCRPVTVETARRLTYLWRWLGVGQATTVTWSLEPAEGGTCITVLEDAMNPPWDWQTWNGGGWPGILDQLAAYLRTGTEWRWPWRRMGPYAQVELPISFAEAWERLMSSGGTRFWLQLMRGSLAPGETTTLLMGDASGSVEMVVRDVVQPGEQPPSFLPHLDFALRRPVWGAEVGGRIWMEPAGWGKCLLQVVHYNWENVAPGVQLSDRKIVASFWAGAVRRAALMCGAGQARLGPHSWA